VVYYGLHFSFLKTLYKKGYNDRIPLGPIIIHERSDYLGNGSFFPSLSTDNHEGKERWWRLPFTDEGSKAASRSFLTGLMNEHGRSDRRPFLFQTKGGVAVKRWRNQDPAPVIYAIQNKPEIIISSFTFR
jgi:hypothetical protein